MAARCVPQAISHPSQAHGPRCSHKDLGMLYDHGHPSMGQRTDDRRRVASHCDAGDTSPPALALPCPV